MSVLIRGMEMPKGCIGCLFKDIGMHTMTQCMLVAGWVKYADDGNGIPDACPLVEVPEYHGELIDRNYLMAIYEDRFEKVIDRYGNDSSEAGILSGAIKLLMDQDVIIEVE